MHLLACMICHGIIQGWKLSQWMSVSNVTYCHVINNGILEKPHSRVQEHPFCIMPPQQKNYSMCEKEKVIFNNTGFFASTRFSAVRFSLHFFFKYFSANINLVLALSSTSSKYLTKTMFPSTRDFAINIETQQHKLTSEQFCTERCSSTCW